MLSCKEVTQLASDYLDKNIEGTLTWQVRLHLVACKCCRRFMRHLKITTQVVPQFVYNHSQDENLDIEALLKRIKERATQQQGKES